MPCHPRRCSRAGGVSVTKGGYVMRSLSRSKDHQQFGASNLLDDAELNEFRTLLGEDKVISETFEEFLKRYNGGVFDECVYPDTQEGPVVASTFFPVSSTEDESINRQLAYFRDEVGDQYIPFASDPGGNYFLVGCASESAGTVYFWNHETRRIFEVASSFDDFLLGLLVDN